MPSASKILGDLVSSAGAISVTSGVANTAITGTITTAQIADAAITTPKIADGSIVTADIADGNVTSDKIVSVANTKITGNITGSQIAPNVSLSGTVTATSFSGDGAGLTGIVSGGANPPITTTYNSPATYTKPGTVKFALIELYGAGGGGGGGGAFTNAGGTGGVGATTSFGPIVSVTGGNGGVGGNTYSIAPSNGNNPGPTVPVPGFAGNPGSPGSTGAASVSASGLQTIATTRDGVVTVGHAGGGGGGAGYGHAQQHGQAHIPQNEGQYQECCTPSPAHNSRHGGNGGTGGSGGGVTAWIPSSNVTPTVAVTIGAAGNPGAAGTGTTGPSTVAGNAGAVGTAGKIILTQFF
jgi:hypothetical protein